MSRNIFEIIYIFIKWKRFVIVHVCSIGVIINNFSLDIKMVNRVKGNKNIILQLIIRFKVNLKEMLKQHTLCYIKCMVGQIKYSR